MCKSSPELILAIVAIGAMYRFQATTGKALHRAAKLLMSAKEHYIATESIEGLHFLQALLLLEVHALWEDPTSVSPLNPSQQRLLIECARSRRLSAPLDGHWYSWAMSESLSRLSLASFCVINIRAVFNHTSPAVAANEVHAPLPASAALWASVSADSWLQVSDGEPVALDFHEAYKRLFTGEATATSSYGCFALLQAIIQRIDFCRRLSLDGALRSSDTAEIE